MATRLEDLPTSILGSICSYLEFNALTMLVTLTGSSRLTTKCTKGGGVTHIRLSTTQAVEALLNNMALVAQFVGMTHFYLEDRHISIELAIFHCLLTLLPRTLRDLRLFLWSDHMLSGPPGDHWPTENELFTVTNIWGEASLSLDEIFPDLHTFHFSVSNLDLLPHSYQVLLAHLPPSLTSLHLHFPAETGWPVETTPTWISTRDINLSGLTDFAWSNKLINHIFATIVCPNTTLDPSEIENMVYKWELDRLATVVKLPLDSLTSLTLRRTEYDPSLFLLSRFAALTTLKLYLECKAGDSLVGIFPASLTSLTLHMPHAPDFESFMQFIPNLTKLRFRLMDDQALTITYLPNSLKILQLPALAVTFQCPLPHSLNSALLTGPTLEDMLGEDAIIDWPPALTELDFLDRTDPSMSIGISPEQLLRLPPTLNRLRGFVKIMAEHAAEIAKLIKWTEKDVTDYAWERFAPKQLVKEMCVLSVAIDNEFWPAVEELDAIETWEDFSLDFPGLTPFNTLNKLAKAKNLTIFNSATDQSAGSLLVSSIPPNIKTLNFHRPVEWSIPDKGIRRVYDEFEFGTKILRANGHFSLPPNTFAKNLLLTVRHFDKSPHALPANLETLQIIQPVMVWRQIAPKLIEVYPPLQSAPLLTKLCLYEVLPEHAPIVMTLPNTLTELRLAFVQSAILKLPENAGVLPPAVSSSAGDTTSSSLSTCWLPHLKRLQLWECWFPLATFLDRIPTLEVFYASHLAVNSKLMPDLNDPTSFPDFPTIHEGASTPEQFSKLDIHSLFHILIVVLLPARHRHHEMDFIVEWNQESFSKLPRTLQTFEMDLPPPNVFAAPLTDLSFLPPSLTHLTLDQIESGPPFSPDMPASTEEELLRSIPPTISCLSLSFSSWHSPVNAILNAIPREVTRLRVFFSNGNVAMVDLTNLDTFGRLPQIERLIFGWEGPLTEQLLSLLPKTLKTLDLETGPLDGIDQDVLRVLIKRLLPNLIHFHSDSLGLSYKYNV